jgi:hypothetical protein
MGATCETFGRRCVRRLPNETEQSGGSIIAANHTAQQLSRTRRAVDLDGECAACFSVKLAQVMVEIVH